jgi:hypothetical protein
MQIRIRQTGAVMYEDEYRRNHFDMGLAQALTEEILNDRGADIVFEGPQATGGNQYQYSMLQGVEQIGGKWYTKYVLGPIFTDGETTAAEQETAYKARMDSERAETMRTERNDKLKDCDWTQISDSTADKTAWATYRQALRDVPTQEGFPWTIIWPDAP